MSGKDNGRIRRANPSEARRMTELTLRSKAYWGYSEEFMSAAARELEFRPEKFTPDFLVYVIEDGETMAGFCSLRPIDAATVELDDLFVDPPFIGRGYGKRLWLHAVEVARRRGYRVLRLTADPNAEPFYLAQGAQRVGETVSPIQAGRLLPAMEYRL